MGSLLAPCSTVIHPEALVHAEIQRCYHFMSRRADWPSYCPCLPKDARVLAAVGMDMVLERTNDYLALQE